MAPSRSEKKDTPPLRQSTLSHFRNGGSTITGLGVSESEPLAPAPAAEPESNEPNEPAAAAAAAGDARVTTDVLIAIKPIHLANITSQRKNHEYRKYRLRDEVVRLWLYETSDGGQGRAAITFVPPPPPPTRHHK